jgi:hypothetical protein
MAGSRAKEEIWAQEKRTSDIWGFPQAQDYYLQRRILVFYQIQAGAYLLVGGGHHVWEEAIESLVNPR